MEDCPGDGRVPVNSEQEWKLFRKGRAFEAEMR